MTHKPKTNFSHPPVTGFPGDLLPGTFVPNHPPERSRKSDFSSETLPQVFAALGWPQENQKDVRQSVDRLRARKTDWRQFAHMTSEPRKSVMSTIRLRNGYLGKRLSRPLNELVGLVLTSVLFLIGCGSGTRPGANPAAQTEPPNIVTQPANASVPMGLSAVFAVAAIASALAADGVSVSRRPTAVTACR